MLYGWGEMRLQVLPFVLLQFLKSSLEWSILNQQKWTNYADKWLFRKSFWSDLFHSKTVSLQVYKAVNIYVALIGLEIWTDNDKCSLSPIAGSTLDNFSKWRNSDLLKRKRNDNAQLITYVSRLFLLWLQSSWVSQRLQCSLTTQGVKARSLKAAGKCISPNPTSIYFAILAHIHWFSLIQALHQMICTKPGAQVSWMEM